MQVLVLSDSGAASEFITKGLKYENIYADPKIFNEEWFSLYTFHIYSAILCKISEKTILNETLFNKLLQASKKCPLFVIDYKSKAANSFKGIKENILIFPKEVPLRVVSLLIKKIAHKNEESSRKILRVNDVQLNPFTREVFRYGKKFNLRNKEFLLLEYLMTNPDQILSRQKILENVWDRNANIFTNTVDVHIYTLRKKIDYKLNNPLIETVHCTGYILHSDPKI